MARDDDLSRAVFIRRLTELAIGAGLRADLHDHVGRETDHRRHRALAFGYRFLHELSAQVHQTDGIREAQRTGCH